MKNCVTNVINSKKKKEPSDMILKKEINQIETVFTKEGAFSKEFTRQLSHFIQFVLKRYSMHNMYSDDMLHFAYLRVMERLGQVLPEFPKLNYECTKNQDAIKAWAEVQRKCLFDSKRSNLGNYIFSIVRHAHSNFVYHDSKKYNELEVQPDTLREPEILYNNDDIVYTALKIIDKTSAYDMPEGLRRYVLWKQGT